MFSHDHERGINMRAPNNSLERTGDASAEARDNGDAGFCMAL